MVPDPTTHAYGSMLPSTGFRPSLRHRGGDAVELAGNGQAKKAQRDDARHCDKRQNQTVLGQSLTLFALEASDEAQKGRGNRGKHCVLLSLKVLLLSSPAEVSPCGPFLFRGVP